MLVSTPTGRDMPPPPGVRVRDDGVEVTIYGGHADAIEVCLFEEGDVTGESERRVALVERAHGWWFGRLLGVRPGQRYGVRADGPWRPDLGLRYNHNKLLLDPYARAIDGEVALRPEIYGHRVGSDLTGDAWVLDERNSVGAVPRCVVVDDRFDWGDDEPPAHPWNATVLYEAHVRNLTMHLPGVPAHQRGTYAGMAAPATIDYLRTLGVTAVELLPIQAFTSEPHLVKRGQRNHWGYNTLGFFAPHAPYAAAHEPQDVLVEVKTMVKDLHAAGIEVILDVVYNHTCEQSHDGSTVSWRGLDNRAYYRLDGRGMDIDVTGCGNTLDLRHPVACRLVLDSLRYWVEHVHVDGFRFDLAVALARGRSNDFDPDHPFLVALRTDPALTQVKLIAEPWDVGINGWRTGDFPPPFVEWNDRFRDTARTFWLGDVARDAAGQAGYGVRDLGTRLAGSADMFWSRDRGPTASVNFLAAHDGFTLADLVTYNAKHNEANGEGGADGTHDNRSWNHGVEGPTTDPRTLAKRQQAMRNLMGTLLLATGVPMINAGDEFGRTQLGNNNTYCQDNDLSWFSWHLLPWQVDLLETTRFLTALRRDHPVLRQRQFFTGRAIHPDGSTDLAWYDASGEVMSAHSWENPHTRTVQMYLDGAAVGGIGVLIVFHGGAHDIDVTLARPPGATAYRQIWDSAYSRPQPPGPVVVIGSRAVVERVHSSSIRVYRVADPT
jgi:glycogen operon protein